ncbi:MAG TPA: DUF484 family protein [Porticoccus sp.]|nr:DUF484 family protein [Porticoccus sp.]
MTTDNNTPVDALANTLGDTLIEATGDNTNSELSSEQIKVYLQTHPDFFEYHPDLLELISLPHESGAAVSLVERQISVLRERNLEMRQRISGMLEAAKTNDKLFDKTKRLVLALLDTQDLPSIVDTVSESLSNDFQVEFHSLTLFGDPQSIPTCNAKIVSQSQANNQIGTLLRTNRAICGVLGSDELSFLFGEKSTEVGSVAAVPLSHGSAFGLLAIGHSDPNYYRSSMGTLFISYIAEVLNRITPNLLHK